MLKALSDLIIRTSTSVWRFIAVAALAFTALRVMTRIAQAFPAAAGGAQPFDLQNGLTVADVLTQVPQYTELARWMYYVFTMIDYVFPFSAGLFLAAAGAFALRHGFPAAYAVAVRRTLLPLFFLGPLFDWCENVSALAAISVYPGDISSWAVLLIVAKRLKLAFTIAGNVLVVLLLAGAGIRRLTRRPANPQART